MSYRLRNPADPEETYGEDFTAEVEALERARHLADCYQHPIELCQIIASHIHLGATKQIEPGPTAPLDS